MAEVNPAPIDPQFVSDMQAAKQEFDSVKPIGTFTVATLPTPNSSNVGRLAKVTDLFGDQFDTVRCASIGSFYFWKPQSSDSAKEVALTGNLTVGPLTYPQGIRLSGTIGVGVTRTVTLDPLNGWPGCTKEISATGLGTILGALNIIGTGIGSAVSVVTGGYRKFMLDYSTGSLKWVQLV